MKLSKLTGVACLISLERKPIETQSTGIYDKVETKMAQQSAISANGVFAGTVTLI